MLGHRKLEVADYLAILKRRRWVILPPLLIFPLLALAITYFIQPQYISQTLVLIDHQKVPEDLVKSVASTDLDSRLASMKEQILSRSRLQPIIERYNLYSTLHVTMDDKIDLARKNIAVKAIRSEITQRGGLPGFFISFTASDARTAQLVCGEITTLFVNENVRSREASAEGTTSFLQGQLNDAKRSLDEQDLKLANFQRQYVGKLPGEETPNVNMLTSLNTQLAAATQALSTSEQQKTYLESMLTQVNSASPTPTPSAPAQMVPNTQKTTKEADLRALEAQQADLAARYTESYPDVVSMRRKVDDLRKQIAKMPDTVPAGSQGTIVVHTDPLAIQQLRAQVRAADAGIEAKRREQTMIENQVRVYQERISSSPLVEQQYKELTRDYETAKKFYEDLLSKMNQSKMASDLERRQQGEQFNVMDQPNLPDSPFYPKRLFFVGGGFALGFAIGLMLAALLEYKNTALRSEHDVWVFTQLPTLAVIGMLQDGQPVKETRGQRSLAKKSGRDAVESSV